MNRLITIGIICCISSLNVIGQDSIPITGKNADSIKVSVLNEVVVSASKLQERLLQSPVSIDKLSNADFSSTAAFSAFDALENAKGVQLITPSLGFKVINTRGFANTTNVRFAQLVDGVDIQSPHIGSAIGAALAPNELDIDGAEIISGAASALYGMNTINGLANFITKDPFTNPGISFQQKTGVNHLSDANSAAKIYSETNIRIAKVLSTKLAFKIDGSFSKGTDWIADDHTDINPNANITTGLSGVDNPASDPVNSYGNESANRRTLSLNGKNYVVARTGYFEKQMTEYSLQNLKADASLFYKINRNIQIKYIYRFGLLNTVYQRSNRFYLQDYFIQQHSLQFNSKSIELKAYWNNEHTGKSYNLRSISENIDKDFKKDDQWFNEYATAYNNATTGGQTVSAAHKQARSLADQGRYQPGTTAFNESFNRLKAINNWDIGAALRVRASIVHTEGQINLTERLLAGLRKTLKLAMLAGFDRRSYIITPDGNYFINPVKGKAYNNFVYTKTGGFVSLTKQLLNERISLNAILRVDKNDYFSATINPRLSVVYSPALNHSFRSSYQNGYRFPSIFEAYSNVNSGGVKRVGGLPVMSQGIFENAYLRNAIDAFQSAVTRDVNTTGLTKNTAIVKNRSLLVKNDYTYLKPEMVNSYELGYKGLFIDSRLFIDVDFYYNKYHAFIAQVEMNIPQTKLPDSIAFYLNDKKLQDRYRMWTNSKTTVYNYGGSLSVKYQLLKGYSINTNLTYARLDRKTGNDGLEDGFNTPQWITNTSAGNENIYKNFGGRITYKWQSSYLWQSFIVNGILPANSTVDVQLSYKFEKPGISLKAGATNITNHYYYSILGGPQIGGLYYTTVTYFLK